MNHVFRHGKYAPHQWWPQESMPGLCAGERMPQESMRVPCFGHDTNVCVLFSTEFFLDWSDACFAKTHLDRRWNQYGVTIFFWSHRGYRCTRLVNSFQDVQMLGLHCRFRGKFASPGQGCTLLYRVLRDLWFNSESKIQNLTWIWLSPFHHLFLIQISNLWHIFDWIQHIIFSVPDAVFEAGEKAYTSFEEVRSDFTSGTSCVFFISGRLVLCSDWICACNVLSANHVQVFNFVCALIPGKEHVCFQTFNPFLTELYV